MPSAAISSALRPTLGSNYINCSRKIARCSSILCDNASCTVGSAQHGAAPSRSTNCTKPPLVSPSQPATPLPSSATPTLPLRPNRWLSLTPAVTIVRFTGPISKQFWRLLKYFWPPERRFTMDTDLGAMIWDTIEDMYSGGDDD